MEGRSKQREAKSASKRSTPGRQPVQKPTKKAPSEFMCELKYSNTLPKIPFEPKFLNYPFEANRFQKYHMGPLEQNYQFKIHLRPSVGSDVHLIDPTTAEVKGATLAEEDSFLLRRDEGTGGADGGKSDKDFMPSRSKGIAENKPWLVKTQYIDNDLFRGSGNPARDVKAAGIEARKRDLAKDQLSVVDQVLQSFEVTNSSKAVPRHPTKPHLRPVKVYDVLPHRTLCENDYYQVTFVDPALVPTGKEANAIGSDDDLDEETKEKAVMHGILQEKEDAEGKNIVSYMLPKVKHQVVLEDQLSWIRDYRFTVRPSQDGERYIFVFEDDAASLRVGPDGIPRGQSRFVPLEEMGLELKRTKVEDDLREPKQRRKRKRIVNVLVDRRELTDSERNAREHKRKVVLDGANQVPVEQEEAKENDEQTAVEKNGVDESEKDAENDATSDVWGDDDDEDSD